MKWNDRRLERAVLNGAREACLADASLRSPYRRATRARIWRQELKGAAGRFLVSIVLGGLVWSQMEAPRAGPVAAAAALGWWWICSVLLGRAIVLSRVQEIPGVVLLLPLSRHDLERHLAERLTWLSLRATSDGLVALLVMLFVLGWSWPAFLAVLPLAAVYGASVWSASLWLALCPVPGLLQSLPLWFPFVLFIGARVTRTTKALFTWYYQHVDAFAAWLPGAWIARMELAAAGLAGPGVWGWLPLLLALGAGGLLALRRVAGRADVEMSLRWQLFAEVPEDDRATFNAALADFQRAEEDQRAQGSDPFAPSEWNRRTMDVPEAGWVERLVVGWLTQRGRDVLAFCAGSLPAWTRQLWWGTGLVLAGAVLLRLMPAAGWLRPLLGFGGGACLLFGLVTGTPLASGFGRAFSSIGYAGPFVGALALCPVGLGEVIRLAALAALIRGALFLPVCALAGGILATGTSYDLARAFWMGAKVTIIVTFASPWLSVLACAAQGNETEGWYWRRLRVVVLLIGNTLLLLALAGAGLLLRSGADLAALAAFAAASALGAWRYTVMYSRGWFDLVRTPRPGS